MEIIVKNNNIVIDDIQSLLQAKIESSLTLPNPIYWKMMKQGNTKALYSISSEFKYYKRRENSLIVGRGNYQRIINFLTKTKFEYELKDETIAPKLDSKIKLTGLKLREYQKGVPEEIIQYANGIIKLDTGWGKTICALKIIDLLRTTALIITPRNNILSQFKEEIEKYFRMEPGIIQGNKNYIKDITVASISTLKRRDLSKWQNKFGIVIVDECHTAISDSSLKLLSGFNSRYLYGMTATPEKSEDDGRTEALYFTYGPLLVDKELPQQKPIVQIVNSDTDISMNYNYADMIDEQINNQERLDLVIDIIKKEITNNRRILVFTKRIKHYQKLYNQLMTDGYNRIYCVCSAGTVEEKKIQKEKLRKLQQGNTEFNVIFGTYSMLSMGVDIPALDTLVFAGDLKASVLVKQSAGRIMRLFEGKKKPKIIDMVDNQNPILYNQFKKRKQFYNKNEWVIK